MDSRIVKKSLLPALFVILSLCGVALATSGWENQSAKAFAGIAIVSDTKTQSVAIPASSTVYTLPNQNAPYIICADANKLYLSCGSGTPTVAISAGGFSLFVPANSCKGPIRINEEKCAYIGPSASGYATFELVGP